MKKGIKTRVSKMLIFIEGGIFINAVKKIREEVNLSQSDLECYGISRSEISRIESGKRNITLKFATKLSARFNAVLIEKNIVYMTITPDKLIGINNTQIDNIIKDIENNEDKTSIDNLFKAIDILIDDEQANKLILGALEILDRNIYKNSNLAIKLIKKLNNYKSSITDNIKKKYILLRAYIAQSRFEEAVDDCYMIFNLLGHIENKELQVKVSYNLAMAYSEIKKYDEAYRIIKYAREINIPDYEMILMQGQAHINHMKGDIKSAKMIYQNIIKKTNSKDIASNTYSDLAYMYRDISITKAKEYIKLAKEYIDELQVRIKYNVLSNDLVINEINCDMEKLFETLKALNSKKETEKIFEELLFIVGETEENIVNTIKIVKFYGFGISYKLKAELLLKHYNNDEIRGLLK